MLGEFLSITVHPQKRLHSLAQLMFLLVFLLSSRMLQVQIKSNHIPNLRKTLLQLGYRIRKQAPLMMLTKMLILIPLKCLNLIREAEMGPNMKGKYHILSMQIATARKVLQ